MALAGERLLHRRHARPVSRIGAEIALPIAAAPPPILERGIESEGDIGRCDCGQGKAADNSAPIKPQHRPSAIAIIAQVIAPAVCAAPRANMANSGGAR